MCSPPAKEDVWALGVTLYQLLFGKLPFVGGNLFEVIRAINDCELEIPEEIDRALVNLLREILCVDRGRFFVNFPGQAQSNGTFSENKEIVNS
jgi:serine/threonine protein kinase